MIQVSAFNSQKLKTAYVNCVWHISTFLSWSWTDCVSIICPATELTLSEEQFVACIESKSRR